MDITQGGRQFFYCHFILAVELRSGSRKSANRSSEVVLCGEKIAAFRSEKY